MHAVIKWLESVFSDIPLGLLEVWGRFGYLLGFALMLCAFGGLTFRPGGRWGLGRTRQTWDSRAMLSTLFTFAIIFITGYIGSTIVLVPGAQTFESLKDLSVFLCVVLFGYPALIAVPFAYGLSDLVEGVPPHFLADWVFGYFINPACFWLAHQLIGRQPDFLRGRTWGMYALFVFIFMAIEPQLWGYITSGQFTPELAYRSVTPALFFTTAITWLIAPFAMLLAYPLARRSGMFWAEIPQHVRERAFGQGGWLWAGGGAERQEQQVVAVPDGGGVPVRLFLAAPFIALVLLLVGATAYLTLSSAESASGKLAARLHEEIAENINLLLDERLAAQQGTARDSSEDIAALLRKLPITRHGRVIIVDRSGDVLATSQPSGQAPGDALGQAALQALHRQSGSLAQLLAPLRFHFDVITSKPLARERWLMQATPYRDRGGNADWILLTALPESWYLEGVRTGNSQSAMVIALALLLSLAAAGVLAAMVTAPIRRIARATHAMAAGDLAQRVPGGRLQELRELAQSFNHMAARLQQSFDKLHAVTATLEARERSLEHSMAEGQRAEEELRRHRDHLEELVRERTSELSVALQRAESASHAKSAFLSNMSHELRTPLNAVIGFSELLAAGDADTERKQKLDMITRSGHHLLTLINDILELAKIETGSVGAHREPVDLHALFDSVFEMVQQRASQSRVELKLDCAGVPPMILGDGPKLRQVLLKLLSNAVKFGERGRVTLTVRGGVADQQDVRLHFAVSDSGPGIAGDQQQRIFQPFVQADAPAPQAGAGLGLTISREFVRLMGGQLRLESRMGQGSTFSFTLLAGQCAAPATTADAQHRVAGLPVHERGRCILVVDDDDAGRALLRTLLVPLGFAVHEVRDGVEGERAIAALQPDLVLMDRRMPRMDGLALTRRIRQGGAQPRPRIVILTANDAETERQEALDAGADDFMYKPLDQDQLFAMLELQLGLEFLRERGATDAQAPAAPLTADDLATLAPQLGADLKQAVAELDSGRIERLVGHIESTLPGLAPRIRGMLERAEYQQLWALL